MTINLFIFLYLQSYLLLLLLLNIGSSFFGGLLKERGVSSTRKMAAIKGIEKRYLAANCFEKKFFSLISQRHLSKFKAEGKQ